MVKISSWAATVVVCAVLSPAGRSVPQELDAEHLTSLAQKCGTEIAWTQSWEEAHEAATAQQRPVLVLVRTLSGFDLPDGAMLGPFMDLDIVELVQQRYVALKYSRGMAAPFVSQDSYGMGPMTFGTSILVATPEGEVIGDTFSLESSSLYEFLAEHAQAYARPSPPGRPALAKARWHLQRGELEKAQAILRYESGASAHRMRATMLRRLRQAHAALAALQDAENSGTPAADLAVERGLLHARLDELDEAFALLNQVPEDHAHRAAALYHRATLHYGRDDRDAARTDLVTLVNTHPDSRWSWLAAAYLVAGVLEQPSSPSSYGWPAPDILATLERRPLAPLPIEDLDRAERTALEFLLGAQRDDGSWIVSMQVMDSADVLRNPLVVGATALAARALLPYQDDERARKAVTRAADFLTRAREQMKEKGERFAVMDYTVWSKPSQLLFLADALDAGALDESEWLPVMQELVDELGEKQKQGGGWNYYMGLELDNLDPNLNISFSFVTAYVLHGLLAADGAGLSVDEDIVARGLDCLIRCRNEEDGTFEYSLVHANENAPRTLLPSGSAGRGPLCTLALYRWGESDLDWVEEAMEQFLEHRGAYAREQGKTLMHCGLEGEGSHYLMFDYSFAAAATAEFQGELRARFRAAVLDQILNSRSSAGSFVDNPMIGEHYGTAMALWSINLLKERTQE